MSGMSFATKGGPAAPTQTVWFGAVVDRLNMILPYNFPTSFQTVGTAANFGNQWNTFNSSFGAFTTAPDGTTNVAQKIVEDGTNSEHYIQAGTTRNGAMRSGNNIGVLRMASFLKNGNRRIGFQIKTYDGGHSLAASGTVVFDLAGGQVGVAFSTSGIPNVEAVITNVGTHIVAMPASFGGGGWYLCMQDVYLRDGGGSIIVWETFLDNGTGTGGLSNSYAGDSASGSFIWKTNLMPVVAYGMGNNQIFFDDFITNTVDVNNTKAPGFNWYMNNGWVNYTSAGVVPSSQVSVSGSVLTLTGPNGSSSNIMVGTATQLNAAAGTYVGKAFGGGKPTLYEAKLNWDYFTHGPSPAGQVSFWASTLEWVVSQGVANAATISNSGAEFDFLEGTAGLFNSANPTFNGLLYVGNDIGTMPGSTTAAMGTSNPYVGFPAWSSVFPYVNTGDQVLSAGVAYQVHASSTNQMPPNATFWTAVTYPSGGLTQPIASVDFTQMHLYQVLLVPFWGQAGVSSQLAQQATMNPSTTGNITGSVPDSTAGAYFNFFDGTFVGMSGGWGPNLTTTFSGAHTYKSGSDSQSAIIWLTPGGATGQLLNVDYVKVTQ